MTKRICSIDGCYREHVARGWCKAHYLRWVRHGSPLGGRQFYWASTESCQVEGCMERVRSRGFCERHYQHWWKYGTPTTRPIFDVCRIEGCSNRPRSRTAELCEAHYYRRRRNGHFDLLPSRRIEHPGYRTAHARVAVDRGKAVEHVCTDCGQQAAHWSFAWRQVSSDDWLWDVMNGTALAYTGDPKDYEPRCAKCARRYDQDFARAGWSGRETRREQLVRVVV